MRLLKARPRHAQRSTAATLVAELEAGPLTKPDLQERLGVGSFTFGKALADARLHAYVSIRATDAGDVVELTPKAVAILEEGRTNLSRTERRALDRRSRR